MTTKNRDEHIEVKASKGSLSFIRWLLPFLLSAGLLGSGKVIANDIGDLNSRVTKIEHTVNDNSIELNGTIIKLSEYNARLVELKEDIRDTRQDIKQILIILQKR
jgi:hypothetical protein